MTQNQLARFNAYTLALAFLAKNLEKTKNIPVFSKVFQTIKALLDAVAERNNLGRESRTAVTDGKQQYLGEIAQLAFTISSAIVSYATGIKNVKLRNSMNFTRSDLFYATDQDLGAHASNILTMAKKLAAQLAEYGITEEMITSLANLTEQYLPQASQPREHKVRVKNATQQIAGLIKEAQDLMDNQLDRIMVQFEQADPEFYRQYILSRTVESPSHRKTRLEGTVVEKDTQNGLGNVEVSLPGSNLVTTTLEDGSYSLKTSPENNATVVYKKEGYAPVTIVLSFVRGQAVKQVVEMVKL